MANVRDYTNDVYLVLSCLYDHMDSSGEVRITQQEVSDSLNMSRVTVNRIFTRLKETMNIRQDKTRVGRYYLTNNGIMVVKTFRKIEKDK